MTIFYKLYPFISSSISYFKHGAHYLFFSLSPLFPNSPAVTKKTFHPIPKESYDPFPASNLWTSGIDRSSNGSLACLKTRIAAFSKVSKGRTDRAVSTGHCCWRQPEQKMALRKACWRARARAKGLCYFNNAL